MKSSVITSETSPAHFIENYRFKVLGSNERAQDSAPVLIEENNLSEEL
ncbi:MAG: flagellar assembly protein FliH, partial [Campylobacter concisus]|nr:flagellar assembly protein FliH [Campylobacter concisus]